MSGFLEIVNKGDGSIFGYLGLLGLLLAAILTVLALAGKENRAPYGLGLGLLIFIALLGFLELPGVVKARFTKPQAVAVTQPEKPQPAEPAEPQPPAVEPSPQPQPQPVVEQPKPVEPAKPVPVPVQPPPPKPGIAIAPAQPKPAPTPTPPSQPNPAPAPAQPAPQPVRTAPGGGHRVAVSDSTAGTGTIDIQIRGPILETSKTAMPSAHLMIILDSKYSIIILPTRVNEQKKENEFGEQVTSSVTYFWENIHAAFDNVPAGPHSVMIDVSLESPQVHRPKMVGSGNLENDYNGFAQLTEGGVVQMVFGVKNWMTQELERVR